MLALRANPLIYPAGRMARFDPTHFASSGMAPYSGFSAVATGGNLINLLTGNAGTPDSQVSSQILGQIGNTVATTASNASNGVQFSGNKSAAPATQTLAAICLFTNITSGANPTAVANSGGADGLSMGAKGGTGTFSCFGATGGDINSAITLLNNIPYFLAASANSNTSTTNFIAVNLATGKIQTDTVSSAITFTATTNYRIASDGFADCLVGGVAAGMYAPNFLTVAQLQRWGSDPWAFWYPRLARFAVGVAVAAGFIPYNPWPQAAPVLAQ